MSRKTAARLKGFTLIEMLVGLIVFAILIGAMSFVFIYSLKMASASQVRVRTQEDLRATLDYMSRFIRRAGIKPVETPIETIGENSITFQSDIDGDSFPERFKITFDPNTSTIMLEKWTMTGGNFVSAGEPEIVMDGVQSLIFEYYSTSNMVTQNPDEITSIGIRLTLYPKPSGSYRDDNMVGQLTGSTLVFCPNLALGK